MKAVVILERCSYGKGILSQLSVTQCAVLDPASVIDVWRRV